MTAARVALQVNIATLECVKKLKLPLDELDAIGTCLAAAFADDRELVEVAYCEFDERQEETWRWAEREWETFPGGPYEFHELSYLGRSMQQMKKERVQLADHGPDDKDEGWIALSDRRGSTVQDTVEHIPLRAYTKASSLSPQCSSASSSDVPEVRTEHSSIVTQARILTESPSNTRPEYDDSVSSASHDAIELCAIKPPTTLRESFIESTSDKENALQWSPGKGNGPILSAAEFEALPYYSNVETESDWNDAADVQLELSRMDMYHQIEEEVC